eukprot:GILJ01002092.1.p1 GENE.GILJ01002092.1~~GILJ01002092.1.p1  ORF type:complete len:692 (+),score=107.27 GILJ01002092.1:41-2116(+)
MATARVPKASITPDLTVPHPFSVHDLIRFHRVGNPIVSPNGEIVLFTKKTFNAEAEKWSSTLQTLTVSSLAQNTKPKCFTAGPADYSPVFSPDSETVAFIRGGQILVISVHGGEARPLIKLPVEVGDLRWSPDGRFIGFVANVFPEAATLEESASMSKEQDSLSSKAFVYDALPCRAWDRWLDSKKNHVFLLEVEKKDGEWRATGRAPIDVLQGQHVDCPRIPFGGAEDYAFSPDGTEVTYVSKKTGRDMAWHTNTNLHRVQIAALLQGTNAQHVNITESNLGYDEGPVYSPDGRYIAYLSMERPQFESDKRRIMIHDRTNNSTRHVAADWEYSPESIEWSSDQNLLYVVCEMASRRRIVSVDVSSGERKILVADHTNVGIALARSHDDRIVFCRDSILEPAEIFTCKKDGSDLIQVTHYNAEKLQFIQRSSAEEFYYPGWNNEQVQGWILKPVNYQEGTKVPLAVVIHGGPQVAFGDHFHYRWNPQVLAGSGFAVVMINFHGSSGFGQAFTDSISKNWGGAPFEDIMKGVDYALATYSFLDANHTAALGASYGGYMMNYINGNTDRFKALVCHDGEFHSAQSYYTTEELFFMEYEFNGPPFAEGNLCDKWSPHQFVNNWKTPSLIIHGGKDYRLVDSEGIAAFTALQRKGIPSQLLYFPEENHWVLKPQNSIIWHDHVLGWLHRFLDNTN